MFTPRWKKEAQLLDKGAKKFLHYKRDLLTTERIEEIESRRRDLQQAWRSGDKDKTTEAGKQLQHCCEKSLRGYIRTSALEENVEVFFVAIVIALGLRAYFLQPFKIPTNSMYPSLNGINATAFSDPNQKAPWIGQKLVETVLRGRTYYDITAKKDMRLTGAEDATWFLFSRTRLKFDDGSTVTIGAPPNEVFGIDSIEQIRANHGVIRAGQPIFRGYLDTGDLVLVDKFSYHFRQPKRGEVFVFDTRGIEKIRGKYGDQGGGSHYIKRLCGVPGDALAIEEPHLYVNGRIAQELGMQRVMDHQGPYSINPGYNLDSRGTFLAGPERPRTLRADAPQGMREYVALGDNTKNSFDSRFWGPVHEYNLVGPGLFTLWPITSGHWGFIR